MRLIDKTSVSTNWKIILSRWVNYDPPHPPLVTYKLTGEVMTVVRNQNAPVYTLKKKPETLKLMGMEVVNDLAVP